MCFRSPWPPVEKLSNFCGARFVDLFNLKYFANHRSYVSTLNLWKKVKCFHVYGEDMDTITYEDFMAIGITCGEIVHGA